jgi:hypothetical protein
MAADMSDPPAAGIMRAAGRRHSERATELEKSDREITPS